MSKQLACYVGECACGGYGVLLAKRYRKEHGGKCHLEIKQQPSIADLKARIKELETACAALRKNERKLRKLFMEAGQ